MNRKIDLTGRRFGRLVVTGENHRTDKYAYYWDCICDCGTSKVISGDDLRRGKVKSCGCLKHDNPPPIHIKHGNSRSKLYNIWVAMKQRCTNPNDRNYERYGGRGISVCKEWLDDFQAFYDWAMDNGYVEGKLDIDRKDNDKGYSPDNCRFISHKENLCNTHRKLHDVINGEDITLVAAAERYGFTYKCLYNRYKRGKRGDELVARH